MKYLTINNSTKLWILTCLTLVSVATNSAAVAFYVQQNLVTDDQANLTSSGFAPAAHVDPNLVNPWGISFGPTSPFWLSNNGMGNTTLYNGAGQPFPIASPLVVTIPPGGGAAPSTPTGQVFNGTSDFQISSGSTPAPSRFIFATEGGTISGWNPTVNPTNAIVAVDNSAAGAVYKGLASGSGASGNVLYAANFHAGTIDVFDKSFNSVALAGSFKDPTLPAGYAPFNIQNIGGKLYVAYAQQDAAKHDEVAGASLGFVSVFDANGNFIKRVASNGALNAPWGLAMAPLDFGQFSNDLLVGNFGDGRISVFDSLTDAFLGQLGDRLGNPIEIPGLWALTAGNGGPGIDKNNLYFTAGISDEAHGLFGSLSVPEPGVLPLFCAGLLPALVLLRRRGGEGL